MSFAEACIDASIILSIIGAPPLPLKITTGTQNRVVQSLSKGEDSQCVVPFIQKSNEITYKLNGPYCQAVDKKTGAIIAVSKVRD